MKPRIECKALGWAIVASAATLSAAWLVAGQIAKADIIPIKPVSTLTVSSTPANPLATSPDMIQRGRAFFGQSCSHCHADDASGDEGPDLRRLALSDARIATTIRKGIKGEMPSFEKKYSEEEVRALVTYLRSLR